MTIRHKLLLLCAFALFPLLGLSAAAFLAINRLDPEKSDLHVSAVALRNHVEGDMMHDALRGDVLASILATDPNEVKAARAELADHARHFRHLLEENSKLPLSPETRSALDGVKKPLENYIQSATSTADLVTTDREAARRALPEFYRHFQLLENEQEKVSDRLQKQVETTQAEAVGTAGTVRIAMGVLCSAGIVLVMVGGLIIVRSINRRLAAGVGTLAQCTSDLREGAGEISASSQTLAQNASKQAASLEETSATTQELAATTRNNAKSADSAVECMADVDQHVTNANNTLARMHDSMKQVEGSADRIGKITRVIDEIAFQTNILALNAAVEAARAGEAGLGFAVVADEVRNLAQRAGAAAQDITGLIGESSSTTREGVARVAEVSESVGAITDSFNRVKEVIDLVSRASREQAQGIEQLARALSSMEAATQETAATAEQGAATSEKMSAEARTLADLVDNLEQMAN